MLSCLSVSILPLLFCAEMFVKIFLNVGEKEKKALKTQTLGESHAIQQKYSKKTLKEDRLLSSWLCHLVLIS